MIRILMRLLRRGITDPFLNPWTLIITLAAVTLASFLAGLFLMALTTLNHQLGSARGETAFQVYWHTGVDMALVKDQWDAFHRLPGFASLKTYAPEDALRELGQRLSRLPAARKAAPSGGKTGLTTAFPFLAEKNPLPATALLAFSPADHQDRVQRLTEMETYLKGLPGVERVITTPLRDELGQAWRKASRYIMWPSITFLTLVLGLVVGNTVRLSLLARSHEVEILQLVGAYNWYIRLPLIVSGAAQGLFGGILALGLLLLVHTQIHNALNFPPLLMEIRFLPLNLCLALIFVPAGMSMIAGWLAVRS